MISLSFQFIKYRSESKVKRVVWSVHSKKSSFFIHFRIFRNKKMN